VQIVTLVEKRERHTGLLVSILFLRKLRRLSMSEQTIGPFYRAVTLGGEDAGLAFVCPCGQYRINYSAPTTVRCAQCGKTYAAPKNTKALADRCVSGNDSIVSME
jgi:hypothetical protein